MDPATGGRTGPRHLHGGEQVAGHLRGQVDPVELVRESARATAEGQFSTHGIQDRIPNLGPGKTIVTLLCDSGARYQSKLYNPDFLRSKKLPVPAWLERNSKIKPPFV